MRGYALYRDGHFVAGTSRTSMTFQGLACGRTYRLDVAAFDAAGNQSGLAGVSASTSPCPDILAPTQPANITQTGATRTTISLFWSPSLDDVGVAGYGLYHDGVRIGTTTGTSFVVAGLACGRSHLLGVDGFDAAGNRSAVTSVFASTSVCPVQVTQPAPTPPPPPTAPPPSPTPPLPSPTSPPPSPTSPPPSAVPERAIIAIGYDAWAGTDPAALSRSHHLAVFHSPENGPDETAHKAWEAADSSSLSLVYQNFGMACNEPAWTTCGIGSTAQARSEGWLARYNGLEARPAGATYLTSVNMGKPGYGLDWARRVAARVGPFGYDGIFFDDVNVADSRLPKRGVPDGYASVAAYKDAVKAQMLIARNYLEDYVTAANVGGVTEWESFFAPADDMVGLLDYTLIEFCGSWANVTPQSAEVWERLLLAGRTASARGRKLWCGGFGATEEQARSSDHLARIIGAAAHSFSDGNDYHSPFPYFPLFAADYGSPTGPAVREGAHVYRSFSTAVLHADLQALRGWR